jgi:hypothetical protein
MNKKCLINQIIKIGDTRKTGAAGREQVGTWSVLPGSFG